MKLRILLMIVLIWSGQNLIGQGTTIENTTIITEYSDNSEHKKNKKAKKKELKNANREWRKIKKEIRRNKRRIANSKDGIHSYKTIDTVFVEIKTSEVNSQITDW
ncbi:hypothetical protein [Aquimarina litoralis]|uniref:hypothetical protein n=1 Tax=Aquimarina litoralis TaxID=584605 RepID=UPI001C582D90|nr:hypothetical protein [Aquimarina litoralis]MBW1294350.1 hypothetical protein [Aquimarina litoralis]